MTETTARIRWEPTKYGGWTGHVGSLESWAFQIFKTGLGYVGWSLTAQLPGSLGEGCQSDDPDELKAKAERWLEEFVVSLGAIFPDALREVIKMERDAQDGRAAEHAEYGRDARSEQCYAEVKTLDWMLATLDRIAHRSPSRPTRKRKADR